MEYQKEGFFMETPPCLDLGLTLDCGQAFRWRQREDGGWQGVAFGKRVVLRQEPGRIWFEGCTLEEAETVWKPYLDWDRDYSALVETLRQDALLRETVSLYNGIRILRQEPWETLFSFIFSSSNNIKRIKGFLEKICRQYGTPLEEGVYTFPTPERIVQAGEEELRRLGAGYRAPYLMDAACRVASGDIDLSAVSALAEDPGREELMRIKGVGRKVADCVLLFGMGKLDVFPRDRWINRILERYPDGLPACFDGMRGVAQQYLFHYGRIHGI